MELTMRQKALLALSDGQWHLFGELLTTLGKEIAPEKATQIYYTAHHKHANDRDQAANRSMDERIQLGRSRVISKVIQDLRRGKLIDLRGLRGKRKKILEVDSEIRLKCGTPHELIAYLDVFGEIAWAVVKNEPNREVVVMLVEMIKQRMKNTTRRTRQKDIVSEEKQETQTATTGTVQS
jgi:hypothetical protein